jgi:hypothetical protein
MDELDPRIVRGEQIITAASRAILDKEKLTDTEVKWYLSQDLMARSLFAEVTNSPSPVDSTLKKALGEWDSSRERALAHLLYLTEEGQKIGMDEMTETCARCAIALLQEPLIPDVDPGKNREIIDLALYGLKSAEEKPIFRPVYNAYASGVFYNVARFCPQMLKEMFSDVVTEEDIQDFRNAFLADLGTLQKRSFPWGGM